MRERTAILAGLCMEAFERQCSDLMLGVDFLK